MHEFEDCKTNLHDKIEGCSMKEQNAQFSRQAIGSAHESKISQGASKPGTCTVPLTIKHVRYNATVDTGASVSCLKYAELRRLKIPLRHLKPCTRKLVAAGGHELQHAGTIVLSVFIAGKHRSIKFVVVRNLTDPILLGLDFLKSSRCSIDFAKHSLTFHADMQAVINKDHVIMPNSQALLPAQLIDCGQLTDNDCLLFTAGNTATLPHVVISNSVAKVINNRISILVSNTGPKPRKLRAGTRIGTCTHINVMENDSSNYTVVTDDTVQLNSVGCINNTKCTTGKQNTTQVKAKDHLLPLLTDKNCDLGYTDREEINALVREFSDIFYDPDEPLPPSNLGEVDIELKPNAVPYYKPAYRLSPNMSREMEKLVNEHVRLGLLKPIHTGSWGSPCLLVAKAKKNANDVQTYRLVVDLRHLNSQCHRVALDLPQALSIYDQLGERDIQYYCSMDFAKGFEQLKISEKSMEYTSFTVPFRPVNMRRLVYPRGGITQLEFSPTWSRN